MAWGVQLSPGEKLRRFIEGLPEIGRAEFGLKAATRYALRAVRAWAIRVPSRWSTGSKTLLYDVPGPWSARVRVAARGPFFPEVGTRPHLIRPIRAKALAWRSGGRGPVSAANAKVTLASGAPGALHPSNMVFSQVVHHPGTPATFRLRGVLRATFGLFAEQDLPVMIRVALEGHP